MDSRSVPRHSAKTSLTTASVRRRPDRTSDITTEVVAMTFVSEARSNGVTVVARGASDAYVRWPKASVQMGPPARPTSQTAAGNARAARASSSTARALVNVATRSTHGLTRLAAQRIQERRTEAREIAALR